MLLLSALKVFFTFKHDLAVAVGEEHQGSRAITGTKLSA
jgi:hypothetical protein